MADKEDTQPKQRPLSPREEAMNAVAATRNAEFTKETGIVIEANVATIDPDIDPEAAAAEAERARLAAAAGATGAADDDAAQAALQQEQAAAAARETEEAAAREAEAATQRAQTAAGIDPAAKIKIKVNGRDVEMTGEEALRRLQKDTSADQRLEEAARQRAEADRVMREAQEQQAAIQRQQEEAAEAAKTKGGNPDGVAVDPNVTKEFTSALFKGDEEAAVTAFNKAVASAVAAAKKDQPGRGNATPVDPNAIAAQVRQQIAIDSALEQSRKDYPDLYSDPDIEAVAASRIQRLVTEGKPFVAALDEVQTGFAEKFGWKKQGRTPTPQPRTDRREEKLERKAGLDQTPPVSSVKTPSQEEPTANVHDAIKEIAKSRGQTVVG